MQSFFDPWESQSTATRNRAIREKLKDYVLFAMKHAPFYQDRLSGFDENAPHPLAAVPVLTSALLREQLPPLGNALLAKGGGAYTVFQSGGTTGLPKTTLFSHEELAGLNLPNSRGFFALGLKPTDRVGNLFAVGGLYMTFLHIHQMLETYGCMNFPFSNHTPPEFVHTVAKFFNINCLTGITSVVLQALRKFHELDPGGVAIDKVFYGGEPIYDADREEIKAKFGAHVQIAAPGYGTVESWYIGYQCADCPPSVFHAHDDQSFLEIVDEDQERHCAPEETGMLHVTAFPRRLTPVVRYRVGDRAQWVGEPCPCGRTTALFKLLGRGDDVLRIGFDSVDYAMVQKTVSLIPGLLGSVQMEKKRRDGKDELCLRVETETHEIEHEALKQALSDALLAARLSLREFIHQGTVWPLQIELLQPGSLPKNTRTGKLIRVVDAL